jgi:predicted MPP superfamily phosphohydrolase
MPPVSPTRLAVFLAVVLAIVGAVHVYFWTRLVRDTAMPGPYRPWVSGALMALAISLPLPLLLGRRLPLDQARWLAWPAYSWMGFMFFLFVLLLAGDVVRLLAWLGTKAVTAGLPMVSGPDLARRTLLARVVGGLAGLGAAATGAIALREGLREVAIKDVEVRLTRLPTESHGTTIVQLTDLHVGPTIGRAFIEDIVRRTNALSPDIVAITGDLVDGSVETLGDAVEPLADLRARHGVFFVTGNHEYFSGVTPWIELLTRLGIRVLANERVSIGGVGGFDLAGVHDPSGGRFDPAHKSDLAAALAGRDPARELVLLAHQPKSVMAAAALGVGLQLSGHTHGGQLWPFGLVVQLQQPFVSGLHKLGETQIYVSPGTGYWGPPMRLATRAEITRVRLLSAALPAT